MRTKSDSAATLYRVTRIFSDLLPVRSDQEVLFGQLVRSVAQCDAVGARGWSIALLDGGFRLALGQAELMLSYAYPHNAQVASRPGRDHVLALVQLPLAGPEVAQFAGRLGAGNHIGLESASPLPEPVWRYSGSFVASSEHRPDASKARLTNDLQLIAPAHQRFIELAAAAAADRPRRAARDARHEAEAVYQYAWNLCGVRYSRKVGLTKALAAKRGASRLV